MWKGGHLMNRQTDTFRDELVSMAERLAAKEADIPSGGGEDQKRS